ncbi:unnamed protein product [Gongylonema pulchrum]|uniref:Uncharacterized protein n=1 Tax=Gongylonema pulchrum TaxID=637853 RepID=A0A3P7N7C8_9BILA|nr:unnamed protein product [Gongylonema pulchrum]
MFLTVVIVVIVVVVVVVVVVALCSLPLFLLKSVPHPLHPGREGSDRQKMNRAIFGGARGLVASGSAVPNTNQADITGGEELNCKITNLKAKRENKKYKEDSF